MGKISWKDLSPSIKWAIIGGWASVIIWGGSFILGIISGIIIG